MSRKLNVAHQFISNVFSCLWRHCVHVCFIGFKQRYRRLTSVLVLTTFLVMVLVQHENSLLEREREQDRLREGGEWVLPVGRPGHAVHSQRGTPTRKLCSPKYHWQHVCRHTVAVRTKAFNTALPHWGSLTVGDDVLDLPLANKSTSVHVFAISFRDCRVIQTLTLTDESGPAGLSNLSASITKRDIIVALIPDVFDFVLAAALRNYLYLPDKIKVSGVVVSFIKGFPGFTQWKKRDANDWETIRIQRNVTFGIRFTVRTEPITYPEIIERFPEVSAGGHYQPRDCRARSNLAIIVCYRNRDEHLRTFLYNMIRFLKLQSVEFTIFVIEQAEPEMFNRAALLNVGYLEANRSGPFDCYIFHDVDQIPEDLSNSYYCADQPRHLVVTRSITNYQLRYENFFGGAIMMRGEHFEKVNGFSNRMFGWGGEDDNMFARLQEAGLPVLRRTVQVGRYTSLQHERDHGNPRMARSYEEVIGQAKNFTNDGLTTIKYNVIAQETKTLFTHFFVRIPGPIYGEASPGGQAPAEPESQSNT